MKNKNKKEKSSKNRILVVVISLIVILAIFLLLNSSNSSSDNKGNTQSSSQIENLDNVSMVDGKQVIKINAKGGYSPKKTIAKAGIPTVLEFNTNVTFDCSSSVRIPSLNVSKILPNTGKTDIDLGSPLVGKLQGMCGMGMYRFEINFQD